jgi:hypothetical protein
MCMFQAILPQFLKMKDLPHHTEVGAEINNLLAYNHDGACSGFGTLRQVGGPTPVEAERSPPPDHALSAEMIGFDERLHCMTERLFHPGNSQAAGNGAPSQRRISLIIAIVLSVLIHAIGFWWLFARVPSMPQLAMSGDDGRITITLAAPAAPAVTLPAQPPSPPVPAPASAPPEEKPAARRPPHKKERKPLVAIKPVITAPSAMLRPLPNAAPAAALPDDMSSMLEAARKRRAAARVQDNPAAADSEAAPEDETQRANRIVRANVAAAQIGSKGVDHDQNGGVFQIRHVGLHHAEFMFRGWNSNFGRNSSQLVTVDQGTDRDIQIAVVKKMIELIRSKKTDEFIWDSHRLGKELTLSAKPEHEVELQQFLLREFFPDYVPTARLD